MGIPHVLYWTYIRFQEKQSNLLKKTVKSARWSDEFDRRVVSGCASMFRAPRAQRLYRGYDLINLAPFTSQNKKQVTFAEKK